MNNYKDKNYYTLNWFKRYFYSVSKIEIILSFITCIVFGYFYIIFNFPEENLIKGFVCVVVFWVIISAISMMMINDLGDQIENFLAGRKNPNFFIWTILYFFIFGGFLHLIRFWSFILD